MGLTSYLWLVGLFVRWMTDGKLWLDLHGYPMFAADLRWISHSNHLNILNHKPHADIYLRKKNWVKCSSFQLHPKIIPKSSKLHQNPLAWPRHPRYPRHYPRATSFKGLRQGGLQEGFPIAARLASSKGEGAGIRSKKNGKNWETNCCCSECYPLVMSK